MTYAARPSLVSQQTISIFSCPGRGSALALGTPTALAERCRPQQPALALLCPSGRQWVHKVLKCGCLSKKLKTNIILPLFLTKHNCFVQQRELTVMDGKKVEGNIL